jgi:glyoxylase-like metal-dependent hydrolase (beta-lactamase superfamily II)
MLRIGEFEITIVSGGPFRLDGGGMFGVIPKPLWERSFRADERNRIALDTNCTLVRAGGKHLLIDTGNGTKLGEKERDIFALDPGATLVGSLAAAGVAPDEIDLVIVSHLHMDHVGGATSFSLDGSIRPTFPRARVLAQRGEWEDAVANRSHMRTSYRLENLLPLQEAGVLELLDGDTEIVSGIRVHVTGGHTRFHQAIVLESGGATAIYIGDICPTTAHLRGPYNMAYDMFPYDTMQRKLALLEQAAREGWVLLYDHDPVVRYSRVREDGEGRYAPLSYT